MKKIVLQTNKSEVHSSTPISENAKSIVNIKYFKFLGFLQPTKSACKPNHKRLQRIYPQTRIFQ